MKVNIRFILSIAVLFASNSIYSADNVFNTQTQNTLSQNTAISTTQLGTAKDWELTDSEWNKYLNLMQGFYGHYYKQLSPPEVLGINSSTDEEIHHFAEIAAKQEHDKLERELRFNTAFHDAAAKLFGSEPVIKPFDLTPFTPIQNN